MLSVAEVCSDPHLRARQNFTSALHPQRGEFEQLAALLAGSARDTPQHVVAAPEHTDTNEILRAAALSEAEITRLRDEGCIE